jgi:tetratricopeptide (TPR) repeat protein
MIIRAKTKRRLFILVAISLLLAVGLGALYVVRTRQVRREYMAHRATGMAAFHRGDHAAALSPLFKYVSRFPDDAEAVFGLAKSRYLVEAPNGGHLQHAVHYLRRASDLRPDNLEARRLLLEAYLKLGYHSEAVDAARQLQAKVPDDVTAMRALAIGLATNRSYDEALKHARDYTSRVSDDLPLQVHTLDLYRVSGKQAEIIPYATALLEQHPDDGRFELLLAVAYNTVTDWTPADREYARRLVLRLDPQAKVDSLERAEAARFLIKRASQRVPPDTFYVHVLIDELDKIGLGSESLALLQRAEVGRGDPGLRRILVRRLWESNRFGDVDRVLATVNPDAPDADVESVAMRAMSLARLGDKDRAATLADALAKRKDNRVATAWAAVVRQMFLSPDPRNVAGMLACINAIHEALGQRAGGAADGVYLRFFLAEAYAAVGEYATAVELLRQVNGRAAHWPLPLQRLSQLLLMTGQSELALGAAMESLNATRGVGSAATVLVTAAAGGVGAQLEDASKTRALLDLAAQVQRAAPGEPQSLPIYASLLAKAGQRDAAERVIRSALDAPDAPAESLLLRLAAVSRHAGLGLEEDCLRRAEAAHGVTADLALARAAALVPQGRGGEAIAAFDEARSHSSTARTGNSGGGDTADVSWRLARARLLEGLNDSRAGAEWASLANDSKLAGDLAVQRSILAARSAQSDRQLIDATVRRLRELTGDRATGWRIARARWLLQQAQPAGGDLAQAVELLKEAADMLPANAETRELLSVALERKGDLRGAAQQLAAAAQLKPSSNSIALELARLYQAQSDFNRARELTDRVSANAARLTPNELRLLVALVAARGESARALELMQQQQHSAGGDEVTDRIMRLELHRRRNEISQGDALVNELLSQPGPRVVEVVAAYFAATGRPLEAESALGKLETLQLPPGGRDQILARHYELTGRTDVALRHYRAAAAADPENVQAARGLVISSLRAGRVSDALAAADALAARHPDDPAIVLFRERASLLKDDATTRDPQLLPLVISLFESPESADVAAEALQLLADARRGGLSVGVVITRLRPLADRAPRLFPLQRALLDRYLATRRTQEALAVAQRCMSYAPDSPELARLTAEVFAAAGEWRQAVNVARQWRELSLSHPLDPDLFLAEGHLRLGDADAALRQLQPYVARAEARPDDFAGVVLLRARAMLARGDLDGAAALLSPLATRSKQWRLAWVQLADALPNAGAVEQWLARVTPLVAEGAGEEQIALANGWYHAAQRLNKAVALAARARAILDRLVAGPNPSADAAFGRAVMYEVEGDLPNAEIWYRRALQSRADHVIAANNLAMVIANRGGDLGEAVSLARRAVQAQPSVASLYDTLAFVQGKARDYKDAVANLRTAIRLEPANLAWRLNLIGLLSAAGDRKDAQLALREVEASLGSMSPAGPDDRKKLEALRAELADRAADAGQ